MTNEEAIKMLKAKRYCMELETSGTEEDCNERNCDNCPYNYEQGNMGEQKQAIDLAIKALEQHPSNSNISDPCDGCRYELNSTNGNPCYSCGKYKLTEQQPSEPRTNLAETSQDCIGREETKRFLYERIDRLNDDELYDIFSRIIDDMYNELPSVTPTNEDIKEAYLKGYDYGVNDWFKSKTQPCEDAVSRNDVDAYIAKLMSGYLYDEERTRLEELSAYLWELPSVTPRTNLAETSQDCISREDMLSLQTEYAEKMGATTFWELRDDIRKLPSVTP